MSNSDLTPLRIALRLADPATADALAERLRPEVLAALADRSGLPEEMVARLTGPGGTGLRRAMNGDIGELLLRAAAECRPQEASVVLAASTHTPRRWSKEERPPLLPAILADADPGDPGWYAEDGIVRRLPEWQDGFHLAAALHCPFPELVGAAIVELGPYLPLPALLDSCLTLVRLAGAAALAEVADRIDESAEDHRHPGLSGLLRTAAASPDPLAVLQEHRPAGEWTEPDQVAALLTLRRGFGTPSKPAGLDWDLLLREHTRRPFGAAGKNIYPRRDALFTLIQWEGCPPDLIREAFRSHQESTARLAHRLPFDLLLAPGRQARVYKSVLGRGLREGWLPIDRVLGELKAPIDILEALPYDHAPTREAVAALLAPLGTDPANWLTFYARMARAHGTVADLVADAADASSRTKRHTTWPRPLKAVHPATAPEASRAVFLQLFGCASQEAQIAVVPHFDLRAVQHLLVYGAPSPAVRDAVVAAHGVAAQEAHASSRDLSAGDLEYLLDLDEPAVDDGLFSYCGIPQKERERLLAGRLRGGGTRTVPKELLSALESANLGHYRHWLIAGLESGDLEVARTVVGRLRLQVPSARLRLLIAVWERSGPDAVREILTLDRLPAALRRQTEKLLDTPGGLEQLRGRLAAAEDPAELMTVLGNRLDKSDKPYTMTEGIPLPWSAFLDAQRAGTLPVPLGKALAGHPDCPRELLLELLGATPEPLRYGLTWVNAALGERGTLAPEDLPAHSAPARTALKYLMRNHTAGSPRGDRRALHAQAAALTAEHLGSDVDAWAICLQLLPTFTGTLAELISTAGAMARV